MNKTRNIAIAALVGLMALSMQAKAVWKHGNDLAESCNYINHGSSMYRWEQISCSNYIMGVMDGYISAHNMAGKANGAFCEPRNLTSGQLMKVVTKHLNNHPEKLHFNASGQVILALMEAFPCPK